MPGIEARREKREAALRVRIGDDRDPSTCVAVERQRIGIVGQDCRRTLPDGIGGEGAPIPLRAAQGGEQKPRPDLT